MFAMLQTFTSLVLFMDFLAYEKYFSKKSVVVLCSIVPSWELDKFYLCANVTSTF